MKATALDRRETDIDCRLIGNTIIYAYWSDTARLMDMVRAGGIALLEAGSQMSRELLEAVDNLVATLRKYFDATSLPPRHQRWKYRIGKLNSSKLDQKFFDLLNCRFELVKLPEVRTFSALISEQPHPLVAEALENIPQLAETAIAIRAVFECLDALPNEATAGRCVFLMRQLCGKKWFYRVPGWTVGRKIVVWKYRARTFNKQFYLDLLDAAKIPVANDIRKTLSLEPLEREIVDLLTKSRCRMTTNEILSAFAKKGTPKAESTTKQKLSQLRKKGVVDNRQDVSPPGYGLAG